MPNAVESVGANPTLAELNESLGFNKLANGRDGLFVANVNDTYLGRALLNYGEYNYLEAALLNQVLVENDVVIEVGANNGSHTVGIARKVGAQGRVLAFEPQPVVFQNLCANLSLNSLTNVEAYQSAVGSAPGTVVVPFIRYDMEGNFGALSLGNFREGMAIPIVKLDDVFKYNRLKLIKIDVEGMEGEVVAGAAGIIERLKPVLYVENDRPEKSEALINQIRAFGYNLWWDAPPLFNPANFAGNMTNIYPNTVSINMLCVHQAVNVNIQRPPVGAATEHPLRLTGQPERQPGLG